MKIAIEAQRIFRINKHGMDFVAVEIIKQLQRIDKDNEYYILVAGGEDRCIEESPNMKIIEVRCPTYPLWEQWALPRALRKIKPDILHCTSNTAPVFCNIPLVLTLHDIIFLEKRQNTNKSLYQNMGWYYRKLVVPRIIPHCRKIITVSDFECNRIRDFLKIDSDKVTYIYNAVSDKFKKKEDYLNVTRKYIQDERFMFFLGNTDPKKNSVGTIKGYALYLEKSKVKRRLLIADSDGMGIDDMLKREGIEHIAPYIQKTGYVSNGDLPYIYSGTDIFLYTSYRESFGIPLLEAMACGSVVVTSDVSSMPEVAGGAALLSNPYDPQSIADNILRLEEESDFADTLRILGQQRVESFSWRDSAEKLLSIYHNLLNK